MPTSIRASASHLGAFLVGALLATAIAARADTDVSHENRARYQALDTFAQTLSLITTRYVREVKESEVIQAAAQGMASALDKNSAFYDPVRYKRMREDVDGEHGGIGITSLVPNFVDETTPSAPSIVTVLPNSPAARAGIQAEDLLLAVDGRATTGAGVDMSGDDWLSVLRGPAGSRVRVQVSRAGWNAPRSFDLVREVIKVPTVDWFAVEKGIGYIAVSRFQEATLADLEHALEQLARGDFRVLILDLRGNPGGLVDQAVKFADAFISKGSLVTIRGRPGTEPERFEAHRANTWTDQRILALVDQNTASAAELVAAALRDHGRATLLGVKTYGKGSVQSFFDLDDGSGLKMTTAYYYSPNGTSLDAHGIDPDMRVEAFSPDIIEATGEVTRIGDDMDPDEYVTTIGPDDAEEWTGNPSIPPRLRDDHQFDVAYQTARAWLESKSGTSESQPEKNAR